MTSMLRKFSQISPREKYFTVLADNQYTWSIASGSTLHPLMTETEWQTATNGTANADLDAGFLLKDLGRTVVVYNATTHLHTAVFRQVQRVNSATTEGVGNISEIYYIQVWAANGTGFDGNRTLVARTG
jgi:hypothetical protein